MGVPVDTYDERLTTVTADRDLMALRMRAEARRRVVDKVAAAVMLQSWLDSRSRREQSPLHPSSQHPASASPSTSSTRHLVHRRVTVVNQRRGSTIDDWLDDPWDTPGELYTFESEPIRKRRRWPKYVGFGLLAIAVTIILIAGAVGFWLVRQLNPPGDPGRPVNFTVNAGETIDSLAARLESQGFITSASVFTWYAERQGEIVLTPGYYQLQPKDSMGNILDVLETPPEQTYTKVLFREGLTLTQIASQLQKTVPRLSGEKLLQAAASGQFRSQFQPEGVTSMEGLLFPDTYQVAGNEDEASVVRRMVQLMDRVALKEGIDLAPEKVGFSPYQVLIVASIIEREAKVDEDYPLIAQVIYNRLRANVPLQIDATLYYNQDPNLPFEQLKALDTPWNTYKIPGLPLDAHRGAEPQVDPGRAQPGAQP